jgi:hypothetical protein
MVQIAAAGARFSGSNRDLSRLRRSFDREHHVRLRRLLAPDLLARVLDGIEAAKFRKRVHSGIGSNSELCLARSSVVSLLHILLNNVDLFRAIEAITGCDTIGCFSGRIYRVTPGLGHHDGWHSDATRSRLVSLSLNLSPQTYRGGILQIRESASSQIVQELRNTGLGDAILFRISRALDHRITDVEGTTSKTAFAGWFLARPSFSSLLKNGSNRPRA